MDVIKIEKVEGVRLVDKYNSKKYCVGNLFLTSSHFIFKDSELKKEIWLYYSQISSVEKLSLTTSGSPLQIRSKTFLCITLIIPKDRDCHDVYISLQQLSSPASIESLFCFECKSVEDIPQTAGWKFFDLQNEYQRMKVPNDKWCLTLMNEHYKLCSTYPKYLYVPVTASRSILEGSAKFRSKGRLPVLSYCHRNKAVICRCSQPLSGFNARCSSDEQLLTCILQTSPKNNFMYVADTRPKINAMANRATGKGYENENFYGNIIFQFFGIENIHVMRGSLLKLVECGVDASGWLRHIKALLDAAWFMTTKVHEGISVLVHCSDGWDRTAQVCSLSSIMLDPHYRTIHGFQALIEKDWLSFGHKFTDRYGIVAGDPREISPIFTQFLEATWQLRCQFPNDFEFNERYLLTLHDNFTSCQFGTFIGNCEKEREELKLEYRTFSYWGYVANHMSEFTNPLYSRPLKEEILKPDLCSQNFRFWRGLYCKHENGIHPREIMEDQVLATAEHSSSIEDHINFLQKKIGFLKQMVSSSKDRIKGTFVEDLVDRLSINGDIAPQEKSVIEQRVVKMRNDSIPKIQFQNSITSAVNGFSEEENAFKEAIMDANTVATDWKPLPEVENCSCSTPFEFSTKKIHCRKCGNLFCVRCMHSQHVPLAGYASKRTVPICKTCYSNSSGSSDGPSP